MANVEKKIVAAGLRDGTTVNYAGSVGGYWSSTPVNATLAYYLDFRGSSVNPANGSNRYDGRAVRLVREL